MKQCFAGIEAKLAQTVLTAAFVFAIYETALRNVNRVLNPKAAAAAAAAAAAGSR